MATIVCSKSFTIPVWENVGGPWTLALPIGGFSSGIGSWGPGDFRFVEDRLGTPHEAAETGVGVIASRGGGLGECGGMPPIVCTPGGNLLGYTEENFTQLGARAECDAGMDSLTSLLEFNLPGPGAVALTLSQAPWPAVLCGLTINNDLLGTGIRIRLQTTT